MTDYEIFDLGDLRLQGGATLRGRGLLTRPTGH